MQQLPSMEDSCSLPAQSVLESIDWQACDGGRILVCCSGGLDSVVLAHACREAVNHQQRRGIFSVAAPQLALWHARHGIREDDSRDASFVQSLAAQLEAKFLIEHLDVPRERVSGSESLESTGRRLRYQCLRKLLDGNDRTIALTAHHADDNAETILFNLVRGTGPAGLRGIAPVLEGRIFRPFLGLSRKQLQEHAQERDFPWIEDESNQDLQYSRNRIRREVMPALREINTAAVEHINRLPDLLTQSGRDNPETGIRLVNGAAITNQFPLLTKPDTGFILLHNKNWPDAGPDLESLAAALKQIGCTPEWKLLQRIHGIMLGQLISAELGHWHFSRATEEVLICTWKRGKVPNGIFAETRNEVVGISLGERERDTMIKTVANPALPAWPVLLASYTRSSTVLPSCWIALLPAGGSQQYRFRNWNQGDSITLPDGSSRKLGDVFTDRKLPGFLRRNWAVLADHSDRPVWVPGICDSSLMHEVDARGEYMLCSIRRIQ